MSKRFSLPSRLSLPPSIRLGIVSPNPALRAGLRVLLGAAPLSTHAGAAPDRAMVFERSAPAFTVFEAASLADFSAAGFQVDVLTIAGLPDSRAELHRFIAQTGENLALLLLTDDPQAARNLIGQPLRAWGILTTDSSAEELLAAINALHEGLLVGAPALLHPALGQFLSSTSSSSALEAQKTTEALTERESQVLQLLARGLANKQIAVALRISEHTVKFHVSSIYTKLGVTNRAEAIRTGIQQGLIIL